MEQGSESKSLRNLSLRDMREKSRLSSRMQGNRGHEEHSLRRSSDDDVGRDQYWTTILGYRPHTPRYGDQKGAHGVSAHMRTASESRRSPAQPLRSSHSRPSASGQDSKGSNYGTQAGHSSSQPSSSLAAKPFLCDQCPRRFERRGHLKVSLLSFVPLRSGGAYTLLTV